MALMQVDIEAPDGMSGARIEVQAEDKADAQTKAQNEWRQTHDEDGIIKGVYVAVE